MTWADVKEKLSDVLKTFVEAIDTKLVTHFDESVVDKAIAFTTTVAEHKRTINITALATQSLGDAATMAVGYVVIIKNSHSAANTVDLATGADTLDGTVGGSLVLAPNQASAFVVNSGADGYFRLDAELFNEITVANTATFNGQMRWSKGADIASASPLVLGTDGNIFDVTGTTGITSITTVAVGMVVKLHFNAALTLTHHATDLILPGGIDIDTIAGDEAEFIEYATGDWRCTNYTPNQVLPLAGVERKFKAADTSRDTTTTVTDDPDLAGWTLEAASWYKMEGVLSINVGFSGTGDFDYIFEFDNAPVLNDGCFFATDRANNIDGNKAALIAENTITLSLADDDMAIIKGFVQTHASSVANVDFQWAQNSSHAIAVTLKAGSWIEFTKIA